MKQKYRTIILSDIHLWDPANMSDRLIDFLKKIEVENIILNWDIIDLRELSAIGEWTEKETNFINYLIKLSESGINISYINWNHDKFIKNFANIYIPGIKIKSDMYYTSWNNKKYYICHWDRFDFVNTHLIFVWRAANFVYSLVYVLEVFIKKIFKIKTTFSLSQSIKILQKKLSFPQKKITEFMKNMKADWLILGHYHLPSQTYYSNKEYINSWDWLYHCTAIVETKDGKLKLINPVSRAK